MKLDVHELIAELKEIMAELGRVPTRSEYRLRVPTPNRYQTFFPSWSEFTRAAFSGGVTKKDQKSSTKKIIQDFFNVSVDELLEKKQEEVRFPVIGPFPRILCIPDMHCPFWHEPSIQLVYDLIPELKPDIIVGLGDAYDFYSFSRFPKSHYIIDVESEVREGRKQLESFWAEIKNLCPKAPLYNLLGNHCVRPHKTMIQNAPELEPFFNFNSLFEFDGVKTIFDTRSPLVLAGINFIHGYMSGNGKHRKKFQGHVVHAHTHNGAIIMDRVDGKLLFELDCGYLGDPSRKVFNYTAVKETNWTRGVGLIDIFGPMFIPFE